MPTPISIIACNYDRKHNDLAIYKTTNCNGVVGSYKLRWQIEMAGPAGPVQALERGQSADASPIRIPKIWSTYAFLDDEDPESYLKQLSIEYLDGDKNRRLFVVTGNYEPLEPGDQPSGGGPPINANPVPTERKPRTWWERQVISSIRNTDANGYVVKNFTNTLYDDLIEHDRTKGVLVAEVNLADAGAVIDYTRKFENAVNSIAWTFQGRVIEPRAALIQQVLAGQLQNEGAFTFYPTQIRISFADIGQNWDDRMPEMSATHFTKTSGNYDVDPATGQRKITSAGRLVPLAPDGTRLSDQQTILTTLWATRKQSDFNQFLELNR